MIRILSTNVSSPLGASTVQNWSAVKSGKSALSFYERWKDIPEPVCAAFFSPEQVREFSMEGFSRFESLVIRSVREASSHTGIDIASPRTIFILATTKGNVEELAATFGKDGDYLSPGATAEKISAHLGFTTTPVVVCNACISGVTAQLLALRLIENGDYDTAVVCGADCQTSFTVAGFLSFKSLSPAACRPFDIERLGLNLGEAAATIIFGRVSGDGSKEDDCWKLMTGCLTNDAYHPSAPAPDGNGVCRAVLRTMEGVDPENLATVCAHGTATMFNDQMESRAIESSGLSGVPVTAFKGYYGHTLGASGVLEPILAMESIDRGLLLPVKGFGETGVSGKISVNKELSPTDKLSFLKIISGFGGCNGAALFCKGESRDNAGCKSMAVTETITTHIVRITPDSVETDGEKIPVDGRGQSLLTEIYKSRINDFPKFYKMDAFSRLVFVASELLARQEGETPESRGDRAIVLFNCNSSVVADRQHLSTICGDNGFFPSPSVFLYTLPNVVMGEIAAKRKYTGETSLYILGRKDEKMMSKIVEASFRRSGPDSMITGWADCRGEDNFEAEMKIMSKN